MRRNFIFTLMLVFSITIQAQQKLFTVEDVVSGGRSFQQGMNQLSWIPETNNFSWTQGNGDKGLLLSSDVKKSIVDTILKFSDLNSALKAKSSNPVMMLNMRWINSDQFTFWSGNTFFTYSTKFKNLIKNNSVPADADNKSVASNNKFIAYTVKNNLFVSLDENKQVQITAESDSNIICGQSVHRDEFGINGGIFWSPKSNYIAFYRMDQTMVKDYPLVDISSTPANLKKIKYPMNGQASHHVTVGIYDINSGKTTWLQTGEPLDQYLTSLTWSPDEKYFFIAHLNRDQNVMQFKKYSTADGKQVKVLFEEKNDKYVEPMNPLTFLPNSNDKFLWQSQRDGFNHIYLYDVEGNLIRQVTQGKWVVTSLNGFDSQSKNIFITATKETPLERHLYKVSLDDVKMQRITTQPGTHYTVSNTRSNYYIDTYSNTTTPRTINLINDKNEIVRNLFTSANPYKDFKIPFSKIFSIKNEEGIELFCRLTYPTDFDSTKKYPVIVYVYGGPHDQEVNNSFGMGRYFNWFYLMAQKGYFIFTLDNRGSANRGLAFEQATFRHLGTIEVKDQMTGVNYLKSLPYIDSKRFGVFGWSYGGFMATSLMLRTNDAFKVGVGGGAVIDWKFYEIMYGERYMDTYQTNPEGFKEASLLNYVDKLNGKLLLVHGTSDPTVVWQNTLSFCKKAQELNKQLDYFPYVGHEHGVAGKESLHLYTKITNYFLDNL